MELPIGRELVETRFAIASMRVRCDREKGKKGKREREKETR
jgi:hypothetical protein